MPASPTAPNPMARSLIRARGKPYAGKREGAAAAPRSRDASAPARRSTASARSTVMTAARRSPDRAAMIAAPAATETSVHARRSATRNALYAARRRGDARPARRVGEGIRRQAALYTARRRREAALYAARRGSARRRSSARRPSRAKIWRRQEVFARRAGSRPAQGFRRPPGSRSAQGFCAGDRGDSKPWQKRDATSPDHAGRNSRPPRDGARNFDKPRFDKPVTTSRARTWRR